MNETDRKKRGWFCGCPECGANLYVRNAAVVREGGPCDNCRTFGTAEDDGPAGGDVKESLVSHELGWCGCGNPEDVDRMMLAYLTARAEEDWPKPRAEGVSDDAEMLLAYIADELEWTEHGGSVGGAWLTDDGKEAMRNLTAAARETANLD